MMSEKLFAQSNSEKKHKCSEANHRCVPMQEVDLADDIEEFTPGVFVVGRKTEESVPLFHNDGKSHCVDETSQQRS